MAGWIVPDVIRDSSIGHYAFVLVFVWAICFLDGAGPKEHRFNGIKFLELRMSFWSVCSCDGNVVFDAIPEH